MKAKVIFTLDGKTTTATIEANYLIDAMERYRKEVGIYFGEEDKFGACIACIRPAQIGKIGKALGIRIRVWDLYFVDSVYLDTKEFAYPHTKIIF